MSNINSEKKSLHFINKPKNFTTAMDEGQNFVCLELVRVLLQLRYAIGRMDKNTTGLLVFTNDTDMIRKFTLPNQNHLNIQVSLDKNLKFEDLEKINKGLFLTDTVLLKM
jgi:23S rRNA pseudouridine2605 synthase